MARKVTITKEMILESALKMLIRDGYSSINIKTLASEIGCSTQPISWHFKNMEGLRKALAGYAREYAARKAASYSDNAAEDFAHMGEAYISMAVNEPNLFRFLYLGELPVSRAYSAEDISGDKESELISRISAQTGLSQNQAALCIRDTVIYSHGIAVMLLTGVFKASEKEAMNMIKSASECFVEKRKGE